MLKLLKNHEVGWPAVVLLSVALLSLAMVLTFAPENVQTSVIEGLGWGGMILSQFMGPILRRKVEGTADE